MKMFNHNGFDVRLADLRPKAQALQVNIYNPDSAGHSLCSLVQISEGDEVGDLDAVFATMAQNGFLDTLIPKAQAAFAARSPEEN